MTTQKLDIVINALYKGKQAVQQAGKDIKGLGTSASGVNASAKDLTANLAGLATKAALVGGAVAGAGIAIKKAFDLAEAGAAITQLETSFDRMNAAVFRTPDLLEQMREATRGTVRDIDLMRGVLTLTAGATDEVAQDFAEAAPQLAEIAKAANALNPALGDTSFFFDSISKGIKRQSPLILDNLGIVIKAEEAYKDYANELGVTVESLDANQRTQAFLNATIEAGNQLTPINASALRCQR